ncbi:hypothetical protein L195_g055714, partial [Trifolium pratense]
GFLGLAGYYRKFVRHFASIASPLTSLLKRDAFHWTESASEAFRALQQALVTAPVLALPDFNSTFIVQTDASGFAMGAVLLQQGHPLAYFSKSFCPRIAKASTYIRELHAITAAVKRWRQYLLVADALSRPDTLPAVEFYLLSSPNLVFLEELRRELATDSVFLELSNQ